MNGNGGGSFRAGPVAYRSFLQLLDANEALQQSYETLMTSLRLLNDTRALKVLLFTSARPGEGKTTVVTGLALAMARAERRVLLVDADLRRPTMHRLLGLDNTQGLVDIIGGHVRGADAAHTVKISEATGSTTGVLRVVTAGRVAASALDTLQSPLLTDVIREVAAGYDVVLIDSPPLLAVSDPLLLAPWVDGVVLVVNTGAVTEADARHAKERVDQAGGRVVGVVMNRFDEQLHGPSFHPYHGYYGRGATR